MGNEHADLGIERVHDDVRVGHIDLRLTDRDIERSLANAREVLERHLIEDDTLGDGRSVRQVFYDLTDIAIQALEDERARSR